MYFINRTCASAPSLRPCSLPPVPVPVEREAQEAQRKFSCSTVSFKQTGENQTNPSAEGHGSGHLGSHGTVSRSNGQTGTHAHTRTHTTKQNAHTSIQTHKHTQRHPHIEKYRQAHTNRHTYTQGAFIYSCVLRLRHAFCGCGKFFVRQLR